MIESRFPWKVYYLKGDFFEDKRRRVDPDSFYAMFVTVDVARQVVAHPRVMEEEKNYRGLTKVGGELCMCFWQEPECGYFNNPLNKRFPLGGYLIDTHPLVNCYARRVSLDPEAKQINLVHISPTVLYRQAAKHERRNTQVESEPLKWINSMIRDDYFDIVK